MSRDLKKKKSENVSYVYSWGEEFPSTENNKYKAAWQEHALNVWEGAEVFGAGNAVCRAEKMWAGRYRERGECRSCRIQIMAGLLGHENFGVGWGTSGGFCAEE